jgi:UDP-glucuronate 4-epimerase
MTIPNKNANVLVTGAAGFIGNTVLRKLIKLGVDCHGVDSYSGVDRAHYPLVFEQTGLDFGYVSAVDYGSSELMQNMVFNPYGPFTHVIHLAATPGVRQSFEDPSEYIDNNIAKTQRFIELLEKQPTITRVVYASTSNVYSGDPCDEPWMEDSVLPKPINPYGYSKYVNECQFSFSKLHDVGLRFFTVYGPWCRRDMFPFMLMEAIRKNKEITVFNSGDMYRDFTYIDDIVNGVLLATITPDVDDGTILNLGKGAPVNLNKFITIVEQAYGKEAMAIDGDRHPADPIKTWADISKASKLLEYEPKVSVHEGVAKMVRWYKAMYT